MSACRSRCPSGGNALKRGPGPYTHQQHRYACRRPPRHVDATPKWVWELPEQADQNRKIELGPGAIRGQDLGRDAANRQSKATTIAQRQCLPTLEAAP